MTYEALSNFTWEEASNFTWNDVQLDIKDLLEKIRTCDSEVPYGVVLKLQELYNYLDSANISVADSEKISCTKSSLKILSIYGFLASTVTLITDGSEACEKIKNFLLSIFKELSKVL